MPYATMSNFQSSSSIFVALNTSNSQKSHYSINKIIANLKKKCNLNLFFIKFKNFSQSDSAQKLLVNLEVFKKNQSNFRQLT